MYPLKTLLIGCPDGVLPDLRRELSNLSVPIEGEYFDVHGCVGYVLANPADTRLLIFCPNSAAEIAQLERLNESVVGQPILALVDPAVDPTLMVRAMRAGAAQVVRLPLQAEDFRAAMERIAIQFGHPLAKSRLITVFGAIEGSGVTSIALNLASEIGRLRNEPCILAEGAIGFGRLANYLAIAPPVTLADLIGDIDHVDVERVRQAMTKVEDNLFVLTGAHRAIARPDMTVDKVFKLLNYLKQLADVIVVDGRYAYEELDLEFLAKSHQFVLVAQQTLPAVYALRTILETVAQHECLAQQYMVLNRYLPNAKGFSISALEETLHVPKIFPVAPDWESFQAAECAGQTLRQAAPHSQALAGITALARDLLGMPAEPAGGWSLQNTWNRVTHAFSAT